MKNVLIILLIMSFCFIKCGQNKFDNCKNVENCIDFDLISEDITDFIDTVKTISGRFFSKHYVYYALLDKIEGTNAEYCLRVSYFSMSADSVYFDNFQYLYEVNNDLVVVAIDSIIASTYVIKNNRLKRIGNKNHIALVKRLYPDISFIGEVEVLVVCYEKEAVIYKEFFRNYGLLPDKYLINFLPQRNKEIIDSDSAKYLYLKKLRQ